MMHRFIEQDDTFNYWYDINAIYPIPRGMGDFFLKCPGDPRAGDFKTQNTPGPRPGVGDCFLFRGMISLLTTTIPLLGGDGKVLQRAGSHLGILLNVPLLQVICVTFPSNS